MSIIVLGYCNTTVYIYMLHVHVKIQRLNLLFAMGLFIYICYSALQKNKQCRAKDIGSMSQYLHPYYASWIHRLALVTWRRSRPSIRHRGWATRSTRRGENCASGCSIFAILCGWRCGPVAILWSDNCSKIPGIFKVHFNDVLVFTGENVFRARRFLSFRARAS